MSNKSGVRLVLEKNLIGTSLVPDQPGFQPPRGGYGKHKRVGETSSGR